jgi:hypothetical protein
MFETNTVWLDMSRIQYVWDWGRQSAMATIRYVRDRTGIVHIQYQWDMPNVEIDAQRRRIYELWRWPQGHVDGRMRDVKVCEEAPITCFECLMFVP